MKNKFINNNNILGNSRLDNSRGVALIVALLTTSIALAVGYGVLNIAIKQSQLVSVGKESTQAFFTADTGLECALFWDNPASSSIFATSTDSTPAKGHNPGSSECETNITTDIVAVWGTPILWPTSATTTFTLKFNTDSEPCAIVTVEKYQDEFGSIITDIESRGLNSCDPTNTRRVERGISLTI